MNHTKVIGIVGLGTMGAGIVEVFARQGYQVIACDADEKQVNSLVQRVRNSLSQLVSRGKLTIEECEQSLAKIKASRDFSQLRPVNFLIEAVVEDLTAKHALFRSLEPQVSENTIIATNTSSLSIAALSRAFNQPQRFIGVHFFNPATRMQLVELIPSLQTATQCTTEAKKLIQSLEKTVVIAKDTPGFIVNRVARPFYVEALRIHDEGIADPATIDWAMKKFGGFKMGPFELMDLIGHDVNYVVTETVFQATYGDSRYRPSITQKRLLEAGLLGKKTGRGFYDYRDGAQLPEPNQDQKLGQQIFERIIAMLINEATETLHWKVASREDIDAAVTLGVNYPQGLLRWADQLGIAHVLEILQALQLEYEEERYRASILLKQMAKNQQTFYEV
ncbi:NAD(P)-binding domain-containing protein [bacterium]|nr:NAD(P)-binding domain-containing protein [bacterium]